MSAGSITRAGVYLDTVGAGPSGPAPTLNRVERRDKRGRRIGYNWWREYNTALVRDHNHAVEALAGTNHQMEPDEFRAAHPLLTLKACLLRNKGITTDLRDTA